ncbi:MAG: hypothetical protein QXP66_03845 [Candidatus Aenigmatarchaeota archaeon]
MKKINLIGKLGKGKFALIDDLDYEKVNKHNWYLLKTKNTNYAYTKINRKTILMHRLILNIIDNKEKLVDHINFNGLDNRRKNIRICNRSQNAVYRKICKRNKSGYKGVVFEKRSKKNPWVVYYRYKGKSYNGGCYKTKEEAAKVYNKIVKNLHKDFAYFNNV